MTTTRKTTTAAGALLLGGALINRRRKRDQFVCERGMCFRVASLADVDAGRDFERVVL